MFLIILIFLFLVRFFHRWSLNEVFLLSTWVSVHFHSFFYCLCPFKLQSFDCWETIQNGWEEHLALNKRIQSPITMQNVVSDSSFKSLLMILSIKAWCWCLACSKVDFFLSFWYIRLQSGNKKDNIWVQALWILISFKSNCLKWLVEFS